MPLALTLPSFYSFLAPSCQEAPVPHPLSPTSSLCGTFPYWETQAHPFSEDLEGTWLMFSYVCRYELKRKHGKKT